MNQFEEDHTLFAGNNAGDDKLFVKFENKPVKDKAATLKAGRPIFSEKAHITIRAAGSKSFVCRRASQQDINRFPRHYAAFTNKQEVQVSGTLLSEWPLMTRTMALELAALDVKTVEQLLDMSDLNSQSFMGIGKLKEQARMFLDHASGEAPMLEMTEMLAERDQKIAYQQTTIESLAARLNKLEAGGTEEKAPDLGDMEQVAAEVKKPAPRRNRTKS